MKVNANPVSVVRLGKIEKDKHRTMKIVMPDKKSKEKIMENLFKLKGTCNTFGWISITDDYTILERE